MLRDLPLQEALRLADAMLLNHLEARPLLCHQFQKDMWAIYDYSSAQQVASLAMAGDLAPFALVMRGLLNPLDACNNWPIINEIFTVASLDRDDPAELIAITDLLPICVARMDDTAAPPATPPDSNRPMESESGFTPAVPDGV